MLFPCHLYKSPGPHGAAPGYKLVGCADEAEYARLKDLGWADSREAAQGKERAAELIAVAEALEEAIDEVSPPTRAELEQKAGELKIPFNKRTKDEVLIQRIAEAV